MTVLAVDVVEAALKRRESLILDEENTVWRLLNGAGDGAPSGLTVDRYANHFVVAARTHVDASIVQDYCDAVAEALPCQSLVLKRVAPTPSQSTTEVLHGTLDGPVEVRESGLAFVCDLNRGLSTGLFLDHRNTREEVRKLRCGGEVLNLFAYTAAFSVAAAVAGAARVTSVDSSKWALGRARENFARNGLDASAHRFFADDVMGWLQKDRRFDLVIADPPVLGRGPKGRFQLKTHLQALLEGCLRLTDVGGTLVFSTHALWISQEELEEMIQTLARGLGRHLRVEARPGLPLIDHPARKTTAKDRGDYLKTVVLGTESG